VDVNLTYEAWKLGLDLEVKIRQEMLGEFQVWGNQVALLAQIVQAAGNGDHLDIGTMWGGSAILAALVKKIMGLGGKVHTIDLLERSFYEQHKWYLTSEDKTIYPTLDQLIRNFGLFDVSDRIAFYQMRSADWEFEEQEPVSAFIDGAHDFDSVLADWQICKEHCDLIMFHDYTDGSSWGGIKKVVDQHALKDPDFGVLVDAYNCIAFLRR